MKKYFNYILLIHFCFPLSSVAQHNNNSINTNQKNNGVYELISSGIYSYSFEHEEGIIGTEIHFTYWINHTWGAGMAYTAKYDEEEILNDFAVIGSMNPARWMTINVGPNFGLPTDSRDFLLGAYTEMEINIRPANWFHFGPVMGFVWNKE
ncbi:hypothetical protein, partial [Muriicola sp.]|uniref:hypothetical protein n=1 Tax=Muriicola sp. TaxID=2020856 RepID=UPI003C7672C3